MEEHVTVLRQRRWMPGIGTALEEMHSQALRSRRPGQPANMEQLLRKPVFEPDEQ
jgi:hypothetical protein